MPGLDPWSKPELPESPFKLPWVPTLPDNLPKPTPFPIPPQKWPDTSPPLDDWPIPKPGKVDGPSETNGSVGLLILIRMYVETLEKLNLIKPDDLLKEIGDKLIKWTKGSKDYSGKVKERYQELVEILKQAKKSTEETKTIIQNRMNMKESGISAFFVSPSDNSININVKDALPNQEQVHLEDYYGIQWQVYVSYFQTPPSNDDWKQFYCFKGTARVLSVPGGFFRYTETAHIWVRMRVVYHGEEFISTNWLKTTATHKPWLRPPFGLQFRMKNSLTASVELPPAYFPASDWNVAIVPQESTGLDESIFKAPRGYSGGDTGPTSFDIGLEAFGYDKIAFNKPVVARVSQRPWDGGWHESLTMDSFQEIAVIPSPEMRNPEITAKGVTFAWATVNVTSVFGYDVRLLDDDTWDEIDIKDIDISVDDRNHTANITIPPTKLRDGRRVTAILQAKTKVPCICLLGRATITVSLPVEIYIDDSSNFDTSTKILTLVVITRARSFPEDAIFTVHSMSTNSNSTALQPKVITPRSIYKNRAVIRMPSQETKLPMNFVVSVNRSSQNIETKSSPWLFDHTPSTPEDIDIGTALIEFVSGSDGPIVTWKKDINQVDVRITLMCEHARFGSQTKTVPSSDKTCKMPFTTTSGDAELPPSGTLLTCFVKPFWGTEVGKWQRLEVVVP